MRFSRFLLLVPAIVLLPSAARAISNAVDAPHVHVELIFPESLSPNGVPNDAGLYFKLEQGWHVYWKNPGDAGQPPSIHWTLPSGIEAGDLQFPAPRRLPLGPLMDYGYEGEVDGRTEQFRQDRSIYACGG